MSISDAIKQYYDREWKRFQTDIKKFAQNYPEQASALNLEAPFGRDPNIDHLLQGCTYLSAQIHKRIDEETNTLPMQLAMQLWPQMVEPVPSVSVATFELKSLMAQLQIMPAKTALVSLPVGEDQTICRFETLDDLPVYPFQISTITMHPDTSSLSLVFDNPFDRPISLKSIQSMPLFLADDYTNACVLYYYLKHCVKTVIKVGGIQHENVITLSFPVDTPEQCITHPFENGMLAHQVLFDYFAFCQKYLFVTLDGFSDLDQIEAKQFEVRLYFDKTLSHDFNITTDSLKMNSCMIVNRVMMECEPIKYDHSHYRYPVYQDRKEGSALHILNIHSVQAIDSTHGKVTHYQPLHRSENPHDPTYTVSRDITDDEREQLYISCLGNEDREEVVSITAHVCHGYYPKRFVPKKGLSLAKSPLSAICKGTNILVPTKLLKPPAQTMAQSFIRYFTLNLSSLLSVDVFKQLLHALNWTTDPQHKRRIEGILSITSQMKSMISRGTFFHVTDIQIQVHDSHFVSSADVYFWGDILFAFFSAQAAMHQMISLSVKTYPNEEVFEWKPRIGRKQVL